MQLKTKNDPFDNVDSAVFIDCVTVYAANFFIKLFSSYIYYALPLCWHAHNKLIKRLKADCIKEDLFFLDCD